MNRLSIALVINLVSLVSVAPSLAEGDNKSSSMAPSGNLCNKKGVFLSPTNEMDGRLFWSCSGSNSKTCAEVAFSVTKAGQINNVKLARSSGDKQFDAECIEAICSGAASTTTSKLHPASVVFGGAEGCTPMYDGSDVKEYLRSHPQPQNKDQAFVVVHRIPLSVLQRFPKYFHVPELLNPENLIEIIVGSKDSASPALISLYSGWGELFSKPNVSKDDIIQKSKTLSKKIE